MNCHTTGRHAPAMHHGASCCCGGFPRQFVSQEERRERLKKYREQLKKELSGVEEALEQMK